MPLPKEMVGWKGNLTKGEHSRELEACKDWRVDSVRNWKAVGSFLAYGKCSRIM